MPIDIICIINAIRDNLDPQRLSLSSNTEDTSNKTGGTAKAAYIYRASLKLISSPTNSYNFGESIAHKKTGYNDTQRNVMPNKV